MGILTRGLGPRNYSSAVRRLTLGVALICLFTGLAPAQSVKVLSFSAPGPYYGGGSVSKPVASVEVSGLSEGRLVMWLRFIGPGGLIEQRAASSRTFDFRFDTNPLNVGPFPG